MARTLVYQLCSRFWQGKGGLKAMTNHLKILGYLGVDYVWIGPIYESPNQDEGYDISDYLAIDPSYGSMQDFDELVRVAHSYGIGVIMELVLNHTSAEHQWFQSHPEYYCWTELDYLYRWVYAFDGKDDSWQYDDSRRKYYLNLFSGKQADLNWFPAKNSINYGLVREYQRIVDFWLERHHVDGFHIDIPQALNRDLTTPEMDMSNLIFGDRANEIINTVFRESDSPFLLVECLDPSYGGLTRHYAQGSHIDYVINSLVKEEFARNEEEAEKIIEASCLDSHFMLDLELRNNGRKMEREEVIWTMFNSEAEGICLHQGQELGLYQEQPQDSIPEKLLENYSFEMIKVAASMNPTELLSFSRSSRCNPLPLEEYEKQLKNPDSYLNLTKKWIERWKER